MKKFIFITLGVIILAVGIWFLFFHKISPATQTVSNGSPFGTAPGNITSSGSGGATGALGTSSTTTPGQIPTLFEVSSDPVAGAVAFLQNKAEVIRYVDRATGHVYDFDPTTLAKVETVNNTLPKIYEADWKPDGSEVIYRALPNDGDTITNTSLTLTAPTSVSTSTGAEDTVSATELRGNISALAVSATKIAYVLGDTGTVGVSGFAGEKPQTVFSSAFSEWQIAWSGTTNLELTTNASASAVGFSYNLNIASGALTKILGPLNGLTTLVNPAGGQIVYSYIDGSGDTLFSVLNTKTGTSSAIVPATFPEKCIWSLKQKNIIFCGTPSSAIDPNEPDAWYQGTAHFSDQIWEFNTLTGTATLLLDPKASFKVDLDVINPTLSPNEDYLVFMNKTDLSLWGLKLSSD
jgi:hypothetical protein